MQHMNWGGGALTVASSSNFPKSSLSSLTSSWAVHWEAKLVKPTMSANRMLSEDRERNTIRISAEPTYVKQITSTKQIAQSIFLPFSDTKHPQITPEQSNWLMAIKSEASSEHRNPIPDKWERLFRPTTKSITELNSLLLARCCRGDEEGVESYLAPHSFAQRPDGNKTRCYASSAK